jgi:hypothetical protein
MLAFTEILAAIVLIGFGVATFVGTYYAVQFMAPGRPLMSLPFDGLSAIFVCVCAGLSLIWQGLRGIVENIKPKPKAPPQSRPRNW